MASILATSHVTLDKSSLSPDPVFMSVNQEMELDALGSLTFHLDSPGVLIVLAKGPTEVESLLKLWLNIQNKINNSLPCLLLPLIPHSPLFFLLFAILYLLLLLFPLRQLQSLVRQETRGPGSVTFRQVQRLEGGRKDRLGNLNSLGQSWEIFLL